MSRCRCCRDLRASRTPRPFLFLDALGTGYDILLTTLAREEAAMHQTRERMTIEPAVTGGVVVGAGGLGGTT